MKLSKLYCNQSNFKNIKFNLNGLNVVYAEVKSNPKEKKNSHDLGKTKLLELIDFLLLKEINDKKKHFLFKIINENNESVFSGYEFYLELQLNTGEFLTIKRCVLNNTKISFSLNDQRTVNFNPPFNWQQVEVSLERAKDILSDYIAMDYFLDKPYNYRKSISYSLRSQDDFSDVYKLKKFTSGKDVDWKPFMFDLLGFDGNLLRLKYETDAKIEEIQILINGLQNEYLVKTKDRDEIVAEKSIFEEKYKELEEQVDRFNFYKQDNELINEVITELEEKISAYNSDSYTLNYEIEKLRESIKNKFSFDMNKVEKIFSESQLYFPNQLKANYQDLIEFNTKLTDERNKILRKTINKKRNQLEKTGKQLFDLNNEREELLATLTDTDTFSKFKFYQKSLVKAKDKLLIFDEKLRIIDTILNKEREIEKKQEEIKSTINDIKNVYQNTGKNQKYSVIRNTFAKYYKRVMDEDAYISWSINSKNNVDFTPPKVKSKSDIKKDTAKDEGNTYKKLLCVAFDLAILTSYNKESYYRFVYHDDVLSQQDNGIKTRLLDLVNDLINQYDLQYIFSVINSDLPFDENDDRIEFSDEEIILKLHDNDASGTLFGFEF